MVFLKERWGAARDGIHVRRFVVLSIAGSAIGLTDHVSAWLATRDMNMFAGIPSWIVGVVVILVLLFWWMLEYAVQLRSDLKPKLKISFHPERGGIVSTPIKETTQVLQQPDGSVVEQTSEYQAVYIKGLATSASERAVHNCVPFLTGVRKLHKETQQWESGHYFDDIQLPWSLIGNQEVTIPKGVRRYFDIVNVHERRMRVDPSGVWPLTARGLFADHTKYQVDVVVMGEGISERMTIEFTWAGDLKTITGLQLATHG